MSAHDDRPRQEPAAAITTPDADATADAPATSPDTQAAPGDGSALGAAHKVFARWLGDEYDLQALNAVLATAAVNELEGDPAWLQVISGSGNAKTETVGALAGAGAYVTSTINSDGALLSAVAKKDRTSDATGGLLRKIGDGGILVIKDFTSILSMSRDARGNVLAALREIYDGRWERNVGTDGGRTLTWEGRLVVIAAVTTAYDSAHAVIGAMGDRFALVRIDSSASKGRLAAGKQALMNVGNEMEMRAQLADAVGKVHAGINPTLAVLTPGDQERLLGIANLVTLARTAVERDYQGNVTSAHASEMPTRFAKMLGQIVRGGLSIGMTKHDAAAAAVRAAGDSIPPLRLLILKDLQQFPGSQTSAVQVRLQRPRTTVDRELQALHLLGLLTQGGGGGTPWTYTLSAEVALQALREVVTRFGGTGA